MQRIKSGDKVIVIAGKCKGMQGTVQKAIRGVNKVIVEGVNMVSKHMRPNPSKNQQGGIVKREAPIHVSNVALLNPATGKGDRVGFKFLEDGRKVRYFKSNGEMVDV
jgi:large subunit ribosomal protein L24